MNVIERYFSYIQQINEGERPVPEGLTLTQEEPLAKATELQSQIMEMGILKSTGMGRQHRRGQNAGFHPASRQNWQRNRQRTLSQTGDILYR